MLTQTEASNYERSSNIAAGLCAKCTKPLEVDEVYACEKREKEMRGDEV